MDTNNKVAALICEVGVARFGFIALLNKVNEADAALRPTANNWNITDITEHLFWAEQGAIYGMWKILHAIRNGSHERTYESEHKDWHIDRIIEETWQIKEQVPANAAPRMGGTLAFWRASLSNLQHVLESFGAELTDNDLRVLAHPHPISGALDFQQRLEFLSFHIRRHQLQVRTLLGVIG